MGLNYEKKSTENSVSEIETQTVKKSKLNKKSKFKLPTLDMQHFFSFRLNGLPTLYNDFKTQR